jgi:hypothetical protein
MGCKYWECKYNNITQKGGIADCGKPNGANIRHPCPSPNQIGDYCPNGESRDTDKISELRQKL